jgi:hypothetical protein
MNAMGAAGIKMADVGGRIDRNHIGVALKAFAVMLNNSLNSFLVANKNIFTVKP